MQKDWGGGDEQGREEGKGAGSSCTLPPAPGEVVGTMSASSLEKFSTTRCTLSTISATG